MSASAACIRAARLGLLVSAAFYATAEASAQAAPAVSEDAGPGTSLQTKRSENGDIVVTARNYVPTGSMTATKTDIPLIATPQSISVITRDQIDLLNFIDAQQAVRYTAGAFGENYGPDPRFDFITVRGFTPKQYIDGLAVPATTTISAVGVDLYAFQSLEVLKGPSSVLYGAAPPGGILNEVSRRPSSEFGGEVEVKGGSQAFGEVAMTATGPVAPFLDVRATMLYRDSQGFINYQRNKRLLVAPSATFKLGSSTKVTALVYYQYDRNLGGNGGFLPLFGTLLKSPTGLTIDRSTNLDSPGTLYMRRQNGVGYDLEHHFGDAVTFFSNTKWSHYREETPTGIYSGGGFTNTTNAALPSYYRTLQQYNFSYAESVDSFSTDNRLTATVHTGAVTQKLLAGVDYRNVRNFAAYNFIFAGTLDAFAPVYNPAVDQDIGFPTRYNQQILKQTGIYAQDQLAIGQLYLTAGGRYDWVNIKSAAAFNSVATAPVYTGQKLEKFTYRVGANYVTSAGIAPYVSYATSFEPVLGTDSVTNAPFKPTSVKQFEGGVKFDARGLPRDIKLFATVAAFDIKEKNFVAAQVGATPIGGTQAGEVEVYGAELEVVARIHNQLSINGSYSYNHSEVKSNPNAPGDVGAPLPTTPLHKASIFADFTQRRGSLAGFGIGAGVRYNSDSAGSLPSGTFPAVPVGTTVRTGEVTLFDATLHYDAPRFRIAVNGSNLFDRNYVARCTGLYGCVYGAGRQVIATLTAKF